MKTSLFADDEIPESLSPKLAWLKKHGLTTHFLPPEESLELRECPETGETIYPWRCGISHPEFGFAVPYGVGETEADAIIDYCRKNDLPHYSIAK